MSSTDPHDRLKPQDTARVAPVSDPVGASEEPTEQETAESIEQATLEFPAHESGGSEGTLQVADLENKIQAATTKRAAATPLESSGAPLGTDPVPDSGSRVPPYVGKFKIKSELGRGAFGVVYLGYDEELEREVAIKVSLISDAKRQERLKIEAARAAQIESTGIIPVYHIGTTDEGLVFFVQKYVKGMTLRELLVNGPLSPINAVALLYSLATSLVPAHQKDILHRDLKPDNILIDESGQPWIADFGLAISESDQDSGKRELAGTPPYMSPEQIRGRIDFLDPRSDIWALGVIFYESLTGRLPFRGANRKLLTAQICEKDPKPMQQYSEEVLTDSINAVFLKACAKKPPDRFATTNDLAKAMQQLLLSGVSDQNIHGASSDGLLFRNRSVRGVMSHSVVSTGSQANSALGTFQPASMASIGADPPTVIGETPTRSSAGWLKTAVGLLAVIGVSVAASIGFQHYGPPLSQEEDSAASSWETASLPPSQSQIPHATAPAGAIVPADDPSPPPPRAIVTKVQPPPARKKLPAGSSDDPMVVTHDRTGSHETITDALADVPAGGVIVLRPGVYEESLVINKPVTIMGPPLLDGQVRAEITSDKRTVIESTSAGGNVKLQRLRLSGRGSKMTTEFNAVEVLEGTLLLSECDIKTISFNCVKIRNQSNFGAVKCRFYDSRQHAVSAKDNANVKLIGCEFQGAGAETVGGNLLAQSCKFFGDSGIVAKNKSVDVQVQDCLFSENHEQGVLAYQQATIAVVDSRFEDCTTAVAVRGGRVRVSGDSRINGSGNGVQVETGTVELKDTQISASRVAAVNALGPADVRLLDCEIDGAEIFGINQAYGTLTIQGGKISGCQSVAINLSPFKSGAPVPGQPVFQAVVKDCLIDADGVGIVLNHGRLTLTNVSFRGARQAGLVSQVSKDSETVTIKGMEPLEFSPEIPVWIFAKGRVNLDFDSSLVDQFESARRVRLAAPAKFVQSE